MTMKTKIIFKMAPYTQKAPVPIVHYTDRIARQSRMEWPVLNTIHMIKLCYHVIIHMFRKLIVIVQGAAGNARLPPMPLTLGHVSCFHSLTASLLLRTGLSTHRVLKQKRANTNKFVTSNDGYDNEDNDDNNYDDVVMMAMMVIIIIIIIITIMPMRKMMMMMVMMARWFWW